MKRPLTVLLAIPLLVGSALAQSPAPSPVAPARPVNASEATQVLGSPAPASLTQAEIDQKIQDAVQK